MKRLIFILFSLSLLSSPLTAHGDLHQRIKAVSVEIKENPDSLYLLLKRGILYYQHEEYRKALSDLKNCEARRYDDKLLDLSIAKTYHKLTEYQHALNYCNKILSKDHGYVHAWKLKARVFYEIEDYDQASKAFKKVIDIAIRRNPSNYIDASTAFEKCNDLDNRMFAISIIEDGISDLGPLPSFHQRLVDLGLKWKNYDLAIQYQNLIIEGAQRKETPFFKRAKIYLQMEEYKLAKQDLLAAEESLNDLPARIKKNKAMMSLQKEISKALRNL